MNFLWSPFPTKRSTRTPQKIRGKFGEKFGAKSGAKFEKFGELSICDISDLTIQATKRPLKDSTKRQSALVECASSDLSACSLGNGRSTVSRGLFRKNSLQGTKDQSDVFLPEVFFAPPWGHGHLRVQVMDVHPQTVCSSKVTRAYLKL